jgi:L-aminopeptidase/D-esterase-like protein
VQGASWAFLKDAALKAGHADDARLAPGVTAILFDAPAAAAIDVCGGAMYTVGQ